MIDFELRVRRALAAVAADTDVPPVPSRGHGPTVDRARARRRRMVRVAVVTTVVVPVSVAVAAGGLLPRAFIDRLNWEPRDYGPISGATVHWGGSIDGPPGQRFEVWVATGKNGELCTTRVYVDNAVPVGDTPPGVLGGAGRC